MLVFVPLWQLLRSRLGTLGLAVSLFLGGYVAPSMAQTVVFINPGKSDEAYWVAAADAMQRAADSLGMQLQVIYAQRDRLAPIHIATQLAQRPQAQRPRYVIFTNDYSVAPGILRALDGSGIQAFMAFSGIQEELRQQVGLPRERYAFWLGSLEPRAEDAGYLTAKALIDTALKQLPQGAPLQMVAIAGDRSTPSSIARNEGMQKAVAQTQGRVQLMQEVYGEWRQDKAREQAQVLFKDIQPHAWYGVAMTSWPLAPWRLGATRAVVQAKTRFSAV